MKCCICNNDIISYGHNAEPLAHGQCCDICNYRYVIRARLSESEVKNMDYPETQDLPSYIPGYEEWLEQNEKSYEEEEIEDMYEEYLIRKEEEKENEENDESRN